MEDGSILSQANLPQAEVRWTARRKAIVVWAVKGRLISKAEAMRRYEISEEEFAVWEETLSQYGAIGLKAKNIRR